LSRYLVFPPGSKQDKSASVADDDKAEGAAHIEYARGSQGGKQKEKSRGQNTNRNFGVSRDEVGLCASRSNSPEFSPSECRFGSSCKFEHDLRKYLTDWKRADLPTFDGVCPIWKRKGKCDVGWKCRFVGSHSTEREMEDGRKELVLLEFKIESGKPPLPGVSENGTINEISTQAKSDLMKRRFKTPKADKYTAWIDTNGKELEEQTRRDAQMRRSEVDGDGLEAPDGSGEKAALEDNRARFTEPPLQPSEKRRIYFGPETPVLAPLTTQGNLPFRRLCVGLGAQVTYSEMAMGLPLIQGQKSEWALMRAHESEATPPSFNSSDCVVKVYDNAKDIKFGAQIAANKPWQALKTTEVLSQLCPHLRVIDLNCGCPIDLVFRTGAGSALLDSQGKLEKIVRGMNAVSGEIPVTVKIRMGTKDNKPNALKLVDRLVYGGEEALRSGEGPCGAAAITLHGRSRQQRYTKNADWNYISDCAALIKEYNEKGNDLADTVREADGRSQANGKVYFLGNGDCYSHVDYQTHIEEAKVDSVMIARGALIKPWIFEEIQQGQYVDKSASERLRLVEQYVRYGLETWGSDEMGVGTTRRFLLEWLSFAYRYVPVGILEHLPPKLQDRPPAWRGRNDLETLLGSDNYKDWIKIRYIVQACACWVSTTNCAVVKCFLDQPTRTSTFSQSTSRTVMRLKRRAKRRRCICYILDITTMVRQCG
jgi:tRNA-dihydrouridine synthase 3